MNMNCKKKKNCYKKKDQLLIESSQKQDTAIESTLIDQFPINKQCIYYGLVDNTDIQGGKLIKFGYTNNLKRRLDEHKKVYTNFKLHKAFKVNNNIQIEK